MQTSVRSGEVTTWDQFDKLLRSKRTPERLTNAYQYDFYKRLRQRDHGQSAMEFKAVFDKTEHSLPDVYKGHVGKLPDDSRQLRVMDLFQRMKKPLLLYRTETKSLTPSGVVQYEVRWKKFTEDWKDFTFAQIEESLRKAATTATPLLEGKVIPQDGSRMPGIAKLLGEGLSEMTKRGTWADTTQSPEEVIGAVRSRGPALKAKIRAHRVHEDTEWVGHEDSKRVGSEEGCQRVAAAASAIDPMVVVMAKKVSVAFWT
ncbi:hypothetical protein LTR08_006006 [Meristemomyces frigidus]|nr:hypothetical protein LTR08_006006 [Meristemomyces frigidus]